MALGIPPVIFSDKWVSLLAPAAEAAMTATVTVYTNTPGTYDVDTDTWSGTETVVYSGKARVQPLRTARVIQGTSVQVVRIQIPVSSGAVIRPDMRLRVDSSPLSPSLETCEMVVLDTVESSNPFEITFEGTVNVETVK